jgi:hypothetical protein
MLTRAILLTSALVAVAAPAHADQRSEAMLSGFVTWIDSSPLWAARSGAVRSEGADTILADLVIELEDLPGFSTNIAELRLTGLAAQKGGGFTADSIALTGASATWQMHPTRDMSTPYGHMEFAIPAATMSGVSMPSFAGVAIDMTRVIGSMVDVYALAAQGEFAAFDIPEMSFVVSQTTPGTVGSVESSATYRNFHIGRLADGVIASQTAGPITGTTIQPGAPEVSYAIERLESGALDLGAMVRIFDDSQYENGRGDGVWMPVVTDFAYTGITASGEGFKFNLDSISLDAIEGRQLDEAMMDEIDAIIAEGMTGAAAPVDEQRMMQLVLGFYSAWRVGTFSMDGLDVDASAEGAAFSLGNMTLAGLSADGLDEFSLGSMALSSPEAVASLGRFVVSDVQFPNIRPLLFGEEIAPAGSDPRDAHAYSILAAIPRIGHIGLHDAAGGTGPDALVSLDAFTLDFSEWNEVFAGATDLVLEGLSVSRDIPGLDAQALQMMDTLGYDELVFGASLTDRWSVDEGRDEAVWTFSLENGADIEVSYELTGVTAEWMIDAVAAETEAVQMKLLSRLGLAGAALRLTDRSLLERGFNAAVMLQGLSVDGPTYREQIRGAIPFMLSTALPETLARMIGEPLQTYVGGGQTLVAEINPAEPISLLTLMNEQGADPAETAAMLGLTLRTEPAPALEAP